jgi:thiol-disulfide isomerase/thioredoxin
MIGRINLDRRRFLSTAAMTVAAAQLGIVGCANARTTGAIRLPSEGGFPSLLGATGWINSQPLTPASLRGKVVLIDFWTYTCVNWRRTLPYVRAWADKYRDRGLVVIGVHTPEFSFEHNIDNIRWAIKDMKIDYPIAIDSDYAIWNAFNNEYWPALYFIDAKGHIRHHQFGEGEYQQSEAVIQQLLGEAGSSGFDREPVSVDPCGAEVAADLGSLKTPETYVGYGQTENFASPDGPAWNKSRVYTPPKRLNLNHWALAGNWTVGKEAIALNQSAGGIARSASTHATSILSWGRQREEPPCDFAWGSMDNHRAALTDLMSTARATARLSYNGFTSSSDSRARSRIDSSTSSFLIRARRLLTLRSADRQRR